MTFVVLETKLEGRLLTESGIFPNGRKRTVGIILCTHKDASVVRYSVLHENEHLFASKYKLVLPSEEELRAELDRERTSLEERRKHLGSGSSASSND